MPLDREALERALAEENNAVRAPFEAERLRTLNDWLSDPAALEPPAPLVPYLVLAGRVTLLAAREKAGKSTLLGQAVAAFSQGWEFLGQRCGPGRVLWYAIDEAAADAVRRLRTRNANGETVAIQRERPTPEAFLAHILEFRPSLVVVDTLTELMTGRVTSERDPQDIQRGLRPYIDILRAHDVAAVFLHHQTKSGNQYRGSTQLGAMVDILAELNIPQSGADPVRDEDPDVDPETETRRTLHVRGRGIDTRRDRLHFDGSEYCLGEGAQALSARILRAVRDGAKSANDVTDVVKGRRATVNSTIQQMVTDGLLMREGKSLRAPLYGGTAGGSAGGSQYGHTQTSGTDAGTTFNGTSAQSATAREPLGNHWESPHDHAGIAREPALGKVVPDSDSLSRDNGNHLDAGPGAERFDWSAFDDAA
jgi:hypothetical protein